jgi:hypothetical protein
MEATAPLPDFDFQITVENRDYHHLSQNVTGAGTVEKRGCLCTRSAVGYLPSKLSNANVYLQREADTYL